MTFPAREPESCHAFAEDLPALLYNEVTPERRQALEEHLRNCPRCAAEWQKQQQCLHQLDQWSAPHDPTPSVSITRQVLQEARHPAMSTVRPLRAALIGIAASVIAFLGLAILGAEAEYENGRLTLTLSAIADSHRATSRDSSRVSLVALIHNMTRHEVDRQLDPVLERIQADLSEWDRKQERNRQLLARAADLQRVQDLHQQRQAFSLLSRQWMAEAQDMRQAIDHVVTLVRSDTDSSVILNPDSAKKEMQQ